MLALDLAAAEKPGIYRRRVRRGRMAGQNDAQIAGIVLHQRATLATRNVRDFDDLDVPLIDPWTD